MLRTLYPHLWRNIYDAPASYSGSGSSRRLNATESPGLSRIGYIALLPLDTVLSSRQLQAKLAMEGTQSHQPTVRTDENLPRAHKNPAVFYLYLMGQRRASPAVTDQLVGSPRSATEKYPFFKTRRFGRITSCTDCIGCKDANSSFAGVVPPTTQCVPVKFGLGWD